MKCGKRSLSLTLALACILSALPLWAQPQPQDELKKEIQALKEAVSSIQKDVQEIKALLQRRQPPAPPAQNVVLELGKNPFRGDRTAKLTLVEFSDYQCPYCARYVRETSPQIEREYIATGKLKYVFLDYPLESIHKLAFKAAEAAHCAGDQGKYWEMHNRLFANQKTLEPWGAHAEAIALDVSTFEQCLNSGRYAEEIRRDIEEGRKAGVTGTPASFLAYTDPDSSKVKTLVRLTGAQQFSIIKHRIDQLLAGAPKTEPAERPK